MVSPPAMQITEVVTARLQRWMRRRRTEIVTTTTSWVRGLTGLMGRGYTRIVHDPALMTWITYQSICAPVNARVIGRGGGGGVGVGVGAGAGADGGVGDDDDDDSDSDDRR